LPNDVHDVPHGDARDETPFCEHTGSLLKLDVVAATGSQALVQPNVHFDPTERLLLERSQSQVHA
jgi:hypothetical protein